MTRFEEIRDILETVPEIKVIGLYTSILDMFKKDLSIVEMSGWLDEVSKITYDEILREAKKEYTLANAKSYTFDRLEELEKFIPKYLPKKNVKFKFVIHEYPEYVKED